MALEEALMALVPLPVKQQRGGSESKGRGSILGGQSLELGSGHGGILPQTL